MMIDQKLFVGIVEYPKILAYTGTINPMLAEIYLSLLRHPHDKWRAKNQRLYCKIRDEIALQSGLESEAVQDWFEGLAAQAKPQ